MRDDLLHAQASIDWAVAQLPSFQKRVNSWLKTNVGVQIIELDPASKKKLIVVVEKEPLPLSFSVEVGVYIGAIRSGLDILATSLNDHFRIAKQSDVYFPVVESEVVFFSGGYKGAEFVKGLPNRERGIIEGLKPYKGGNPWLYALHRLDITRKHRKLLTVISSPQTITAKGWLILSINWIDAPECRDSETIVGSFPNWDPEPELTITPHVALDEVATGGQIPVVQALQQMASLARSVVALFDID